MQGICGFLEYTTYNTDVVYLHSKRYGGYPPATAVVSGNEANDEYN
jgi:hypothetical protein